MTSAVADRQPPAQQHWWLIGAILFGALAVLAIWYAPRLYPTAAIRVPLANCDVAKTACTVAVPGGGELRLEILPRPVPVMQRLQLRVELGKLAAKRIEVDFAGVNMDMGFNRFVLKPAGEGVYAGIGILPVCTRDRMIWEATVYAHTPRGLVAAPFRFDTRRP